MEIIYTILCIACLCVGFFVGYRINKPKPTSIVARKVESKKERIEKQKIDEEMKKQMEIYNTVLENINNYDGSSNNQRKVS